MTLIPQFGKMINQILTIWTFPFAAWNSADLYTRIVSYYLSINSPGLKTLLPSSLLLLHAKGDSPWWVQDLALTLACGLAKEGIAVE